MAKTIQTIDLFRWSEPDEQHRVKRLGTANAKEVFNNLETHLKENNLLPDEYFLFTENNFLRTNGELPTDTADIIYDVKYGDSEGIYIDIHIRTTDYKQIHFATGKTLRDDTEAFLQMSRTGAECALMLNNGGYKIEMKETPEIAFKLKPEEETLYSIIDKSGNDTLLKRVTLIPENDPSPFIIASGVKIENGLISWDSGQYFSDFCSAMNEFQKVIKLNSEIHKANHNIEVDGHIGTWYVIDTKEYDGRQLYLLEHEEYGDEAACIIVNAEHQVVMDDVWNGFDDYEEANEDGIEL